MKRARTTTHDVDAMARRHFVDHTFLRQDGDRSPLVPLARLMPLVDLATVRARLPVLGDGSIRVGSSTIPSAGRGLFATRSFAAGELVTFYDGRVARFRPLASIPRRQRSHLRVLIPLRYMLVGDTAGLGELGTGGGALVNHDAARPNAEFVSIDSAANEARAMVGASSDLDPFQRLVVVRAVCGIAAGQEVFMDYGGTYWATDGDDDDDDRPEVAFEWVQPSPSSTTTTTEETAPKRRRIEPTKIAAARRCDVCLVRAVTHVWPDLGLYCCDHHSLLI